MFLEEVILKKYNQEVTNKYKQLRQGIYCNTGELSEVWSLLKEKKEWDSMKEHSDYNPNDLYFEIGPRTIPLYSPTICNIPHYFTCEKTEIYPKKFFELCL